MIWIHLAIVLVCIFIGVRLGGVGLGLIGIIGVSILLFVCGLAPVAPPIDVMLIILAVITAASAMQAAGGLDYLVNVAEKILRKNPKRITFIAPIITYIFTLGAGTGHVAYALMPVISEVALKAGVRPERPMAVASIASQQAITCSPISAATAGLIAALAAIQAEASLGTILLICLPATFIGCMVAAFVQNFVGKDLKDDPIYQAKLAKGEIDLPEVKTDYVPTKSAKLAVVIFLIGAVGVVLLGLIRSNTFDALTPVKEFLFDRQLNVQVGENFELKDVTLSMPATIEIVMIFVAAMITIFCKIDIKKITKGSVFDAGIMAVIAIFGVAWMGDIFFTGHLPTLVNTFKDLVGQYPWVFAFALFLLSILLYSQAATTRIMMPVGLALGINPLLCIAMFPAVNGYFFIPSYPTMVAAVNFDPSGTTRIGKYVLNHSFMLPGMIATILAVLIGLGLASFML